MFGNTATGRLLGYVVTKGKQEIDSQEQPSDGPMAEPVNVGGVKVDFLEDECDYDADVPVAGNGAEDPSTAVKEENRLPVATVLLRVATAFTENSVSRKGNKTAVAFAGLQLPAGRALTDTGAQDGVAGATAFQEWCK